MSISAPDSPIPPRGDSILSKARSARFLRRAPRRPCRPPPQDIKNLVRNEEAELWREALKMVLAKKKADLLAKYASAELDQQQAETKAMRGA